MHGEKWLIQRLSYIRGLKTPNEQQRRLLTLAEISSRTTDEERKFKLLIRAEKAAERALKARADVARVLSTERRAARKARDHELYKAAGLLGIAGIVDKESGRLTVDAGILVGHLLELSHGQLTQEHRAHLKTRGDAAIASREKKKQRESANTTT